MSLAKEIADLLYRHDCVIVPNFGGFLGQYKPARLQRELKRIMPPGKELGFNRELTRNDGLLADQIARTRQLVYSDSLALITKHVSEWEQELRDTGRLELADLGIFLRDEEGRLIFTPDQKADFGIASFGLRPAKAVPVEPAQQTVIKPAAEKLPAKETPIIALPVVPVNEQPQEDEPKSTGTIGYWGAAAAAALILTTVGIGLFNTDWVSTSQLAKIWPNNNDSLSHFEERAQASVQENRTLHISVDSIVERAERVDVTGDGKSEHPLERIESEAVAESTYVEPVQVTGPYHVVIGCFSVKANAEGLVSDFQQKGLQARILDEHKGLYRVVLSSYASRKTAVEQLKAIKQSDSKEAWLLKK